MSLDRSGVITSFNPAASEIFGLSADSVVGHTLADVLLRMEGADAFIDTVLNATYEASTGDQHVVEATLAGKRRLLSVVTSYLTEERDGKTVGVGVVAVFSDISEISELREKEVRLAKDLEAKHGELRDAYVTLETRNRELASAAKRVNALRLGATIGVMTMFLAVGLYFWNADPPAGGTAAGGTAAGGVHAADGVPRTLTVTPQAVSASLFMTGRLAPSRQVEVTSPIKGKVAAVHFQHGERVAEGQRLVELDVTEVQIERRDAEVAFIRARDRVQELANWEDHVDVTQARRAVSKSNAALETARNTLEKTSFLLERGVIPASEHEAAEREFQSRQFDLRAAEEDLRAALAKGAAEGTVARLELDNARAKLETLEETLRNAVVYAPSAGVVIDPKIDQVERGSDNNEKTLAKGVPVEQGERLLTIGDLDGIAVVGRVDEVDVVRIRPGHRVSVAGDAFPGITLNGEIAQVSSQAKRDRSGRGLPSFEVTAVVEALSDEQRRLLRLGMSATVEVTVYERADALLVPLDAVTLRDGQARLRVRDTDTGAVKEVPVATGVTTVDSVEIVDGIGPGDEIVL